jgi:hypothetical protein
LTIHRAMYSGRMIEIETERRRDGLYQVLRVLVEVRRGQGVVVDEMPYQLVGLSESSVVEQATVDATKYIKSIG